MPRPAVLLFDLGGVLVENSHLEDLAELLPRADRGVDPHDLWLSSPAVQRFERGDIAVEDFAVQFVSEWSLPMTPSAFISRVAGWPKGFYPGARSLLTSLRRKYTVAYLSNSNEIHWRGFSDILHHADIAFASHLCGVVKPDPAIFNLVIESLKCDPSEICFFDDSASNVKAARIAGLDAHLTRGFNELAATLGRLGIV